MALIALIVMVHLGVLVVAHLVLVALALVVLELLDRVMLVGLTPMLPQTILAVVGVVLVLLVGQALDLLLVVAAQGIFQTLRVHPFNELVAVVAQLKAAVQMVVEALVVGVLSMWQELL